MNAHKSCELCEFWDADPSGFEGECLRFPPIRSLDIPRRAFSADLTAFNFEWPITDHFSWCGEFKER